MPVGANGKFARRSDRSYVALQRSSEPGIRLFERIDRRFDRNHLAAILQSRVTFPSRSAEDGATRRSTPNSPCLPVGAVALGNRVGVDPPDSSGAFRLTRAAHSARHAFS